MSKERGSIMPIPKLEKRLATSWGARVSPVRLALGVLLLGLLLAAYVISDMRADNERQRHARLHELALQTSTFLRDRFRIYEYGLGGTRGAMAVAGASHLTRRQFHEYIASRDLPKEFPGAHGFGFIRHVPAGQEADFLRATRNDGAPDFSIWQLAPHAGDKWVIQYLEPGQNNRSALGLDLASEQHRREAIAAALQRGTATLSPPITLVQAAEKKHMGFLLLLPVRAAGEGLRSGNIIGFSYAPLLVDEVLASLSAASGKFALDLYDSSDLDETRPFYSNRKPGEALLPELRESMPVSIYGRDWRMVIVPTAAFVAGLGEASPVLAGAGVALFSVLAALLVYLVLSAHQRKLRMLVEQLCMATIIDDANDAIICKTLDGRVTAWNAAAEHIFGYTAAEAMGRPMAELIIPECRHEEEQQILKRVGSGETIPHFTTVRHRADGTLLDVSATISPMRDEDGKVVGAVKTVRDVTEQVRAEKAVREMNQSLEELVRLRTVELETARRDLQTIFDALPSMIGYWDKSLRNRMANRAYSTWFGVNQDKIAGMHLPELLGQELFEHNRPHIDGVLAGLPQRFETPITSPQGKMMWSMANFIPDWHGNEVAGFYVIVHDITEITDSRNQFEQVLRENEALMSTLNQQLLYSVTDSRGRIIEVNDNFCRISGYSREELLGSTHSMINSGEHERAFWSDVWRRITSGNAWHGEVCNRAKDGSLYWVDSVIAPFVGADGKIERYVSMRTDITARHRLDASLREAKLAAEAANQAKSEFLANMSHEIRTPMNGILGLCYLLERQVMSSVTLGMVQRIQGASQSLLSIINDILDFSKIEARRLVLERAPFRLGDVVDKLANLMAASVADKPIDFLIDAPPAEAQFLVGDVLRLGQILTNLVGNALKFTQAGEVSMRIDVLSHDVEAGTVSLRFTVRDTGIGIPAEKLESIFSSFSQADTTTTRRFGGTGLGLTISRSLAELMGGSISVRSTPGVGSEFSLVVPFELGMPEALPISGSKPLKVLFCSDNRSGEMLSLLALGLGWQADVVDSGAAMLNRVEADPSYDIILTDWKLPDMDGLSALKRASACHDGGRAPITLVTVMPQAANELRQNAECEMVDAILVKPVTGSALQHAVVNARSLHGSQGNDRSEPEARLAGARILLVDDSELNLEVAAHILQTEGASVTTLENGKLAVDVLAAQPDAFDIVLMDVQMPVMDGYSATREIRRMGLATLPVVALTAGALSSQRQLALDAGMNGFITKPFVVENLVTMVKGMVDRHPEVAPAAVPGPTPVVPGKRDGQMSEQQLMQGEEWQSMMTRFRARFFDERVPEFLLAYQDACNATDHVWSSDLKRIIHKLAGEAGLVGLPDTSELAKRIEQCWDRHGPDAEVQEMTQQLSRNLHDRAA